MKRKKKKIFFGRFQKPCVHDASSLYGWGAVVRRVLIASEDKVIHPLGRAIVELSQSLLVAIRLRGRSNK